MPTKRMNLPLIFIAAAMLISCVSFVTPGASAAALEINEDTIKVVIDKVYAVQVNPFHMTLTLEDGTTSSESVVMTPVLITSNTEAKLTITATPTVTITSGDANAPIYLLTSSAEQSTYKTKCIYMFLELQNLNGNSDAYSVSWSNAQTGYSETNTNQARLSEVTTTSATIDLAPASSGSPQYAAFRIIGDCIPPQTDYYSSTIENPENVKVNPAQWTEADSIEISVVFTFVADVSATVSFVFSADWEGTYFDDYFAAEDGYVYVNGEMIENGQPIAFNTAQDFTFTVMVDYVYAAWSIRFTLKSIKAESSNKVLTIYEYTSGGKGDIYVSMTCTIPADTFENGETVVVNISESFADTGTTDFIGIEQLPSYTG